MRTFELPSRSIGGHSASLCGESPCCGVGVRHNSQVEHWQHARDLSLWRDILEIKVGRFFIAASPQVCTVHKQLTLWRWVSDLRRKEEHNYYSYPHCNACSMTNDYLKPLIKVTP